MPSSTNVFSAFGFGGKPARASSRARLGAMERGSKSDSSCRTYTSQTCYDPYIATSGDVITATTATTTTSTKKTVLVPFYFFICSIRLRWDFARNSEADISKRELSIDSETDIASRCSHLNCTVPVCMHLCSHIAYVFARCTVPVCMHMCSHIACFMYACIGVRTLHTIWERTHHTHTKVLKAVWEPAPIQYGSELTKQPLRMTWIRFCLFVLFACLLVCLVFV